MSEYDLAAVDIKALRSVSHDLDSDLPLSVWHPIKLQENDRLVRPTEDR